MNDTHPPLAGSSGQRYALKRRIMDWYQRTPATSGDPDPATMRYHELNRLVDDFVTQARSEHRNPRVALLPGTSSAQDLLEPHGQGMPHLDELCAELTGAESELPEPVAIAAVAFVGGHCARMDSNPAAAANVWRWASQAAPGGWNPREVAPLRVVECFGDTSSLTLKRLDEIVDESRAQLNIEDGPDKCAAETLRLHRRVLVHLTETLASLPAALLRENTPSDGGPASYGDWVKQRVVPWFAAGHGLAVFHQSHARILLALGELGKARSEVEQALAHAKPHMLQSIEASRQMQLAIDLEDLAREDITEAVTTAATDKVQEKSDEIQATLDRDIREVAATERSTTSKEISEEISNALLRVVEILGVFLALTGVAVTSIGGIAVEGSLLVKMTVWVFGYSTIVSLFWLLRRIIGKPGVRQTVRDRRESKSNAANGADDPKEGEVDR